MCGRTSRLAALLGAVGLLLALAGASARGDVVHLEGGGKIRGEIIEETPVHVIIRTPFGSTTVVSRDEISKIERDQNPEQVFEERWKKLGAGDAGGFYQLGTWARGQGVKALEEKAREAFRKAIQIDPDHLGAREALGHRKYKGRWYDEAGYKKVVEGLVEWNGQWVTPQERELLEQGFTRGPNGEWVRAEDLARQGGGGAGPAGGTGKPEPGSGPRRPDPSAPSGAGGGGLGASPPVEAEPEDDSWYDDHEPVMEWDQAQKRVRAHESKYYRIYTNLKPEYAKRYGQMLDLYAVQFQRVFTHFLPQGGVPRSEILIYPSQEEFMAHEGMGPSVGGYYTTMGKRVVAYHGRFGPTGTTRTVLAHEGTHQFQDIILPGRFQNAPIWIIEGFAVFFESAYFDAKAKKVRIGYVPRDRLANLKAVIQGGAYIPLSELIRTPQHLFSGLHYAHAWSLIYMMVYWSDDKDERKKYQKVFTDLFFLAKTKQVTAEDVETLWGGKEKFAAFEERWKKWVLDLPYDFDPTNRKKTGEGGGGDGNEEEDEEPAGGSGTGTGTTPRDPLREVEKELERAWVGEE